MGLLDRVKALCKLKGISLGTMEKEMGISNGASYKWKNSSPSMEMLNRLSNYFGVSVDYLTTGQEKENELKYYYNDETAEIAQFLFENPNYKVLFDASRKVKPEDIQFVKEMIDRMSGKE